MLPLRDVVVYPHMIFPVLIGRSTSLEAIAAAMEHGKKIFLAAQQDSQTDDPTLKNLYEYGTVARIVQVLRLPNQMLKVLVEGLHQARIVKPLKANGYLYAEVEAVKQDAVPQSPEFQALMRRASDLFSEYLQNSRTLPAEAASGLLNITDEYHRLYYIAANVTADVQLKQRILTNTDITVQYMELVSILTAELEMLKIEDEIDEKVNETISKSQRKYFLQEQIRTLQKELGEDDEFGTGNEVAKLREAVERAGMPEHALAKANEELERLRKTPPMSPEYGVARSYLEWLTALPWSVRTDDNLNIAHAKQTLDDDHYDLEKPKERILEYISVLNLTASTKGQILCLVGPPGVGKTSLASSIARALGRKFVRIALGGIRDEAEIRGHRRTYIGSLPGKIIQAMKRAGSVNPVILLDEVDKMSSDFRGDPSAALLEVLDPEQNHTFMDHFIDVEYDLSKVLFISTANVKYDIPLPLLDRMEVIELNSYLDIDKLQIAKRHIVPKQIAALGLDTVNITFTDGAILKIIREYTRESGVRQLERELSGVMRKVVKDIVSEIGGTAKDVEGGIGSIRDTKAFKTLVSKRSFVIDEDRIATMLKAPRFKSKTGELNDKIGSVTGLAWTSVGGDTLPVEVSIMTGADKLILTGKLGDVMKESAQAALTYVRSNPALFGLDPEFSKGKEIHIHVPEGAIPKDGPSAGITMTMALISAASGAPARGDIAMTGEVTLRGNILPIGGLNEKLLAAKRHGATVVIVPKDNEKDIEDISPQVKEGLNIQFVSTIQEAIPFVFRSSLGDKPVAVHDIPAAHTKKEKTTSRARA